MLQLLWVTFMYFSAFTRFEEQATTFVCVLVKNNKMSHDNKSTLTFVRSFMRGLYVSRDKIERYENNKGKEGQTHTQPSEIEAISF